MSDTPETDAFLRSFLHRKEIPSLSDATQKMMDMERERDEARQQRDEAVALCDRMAYIMRYGPPQEWRKVLQDWKEYRKKTS